ncbi:hypothetical protein D3C77_565420 [compost metagenome]
MGSKSSTLMVRRRLSSARRSKSASVWLMTPRARPASATLSSWVKGRLRPSALHTLSNSGSAVSTSSRACSSNPKGLPSSRVRYCPSARRSRVALGVCSRRATWLSSLSEGRFMSRPSGNTMTRRARPIQRFGKLRSNSSMASCALNMASCSAQCSSGRSACWRPSS